MIIYIIGFLFGFVIWYALFKPVIPMILLKLQYGRDCRLFYYPLSGFYHLLGSSFKKYGDSLEHYKRYIKEYPKAKFFITNVGSSPAINLLTPEYYKAILTDHQKYQKIKDMPDNRFIQEGLLFTSKDWKSQRRLLAPSFSFNALKSKVPLINEVAQEVLLSLQQQGIQTVNCMETFSSITGEVIIRSFFGDSLKGVKINGQDPSTEITQVYTELFSIYGNSTLLMLKFMIFGQRGWSILPTKREKAIYQRVTNLRLFAEQLIKERIKERSALEGIQKYSNFLNTMVDAYLLDKEPSIEIMIQNFLTLFFAGTDTTATLLSSCIYQLSQDEETEQDLYEEIQSIVRNGPVDFDHLPKLTKLNSFIQEVLRVYTPVIGIIMREVLQDVKVLDLTLKKGWYVNLISVGTNHNPKYYDNPEVFNYKRWLAPKQLPEEDNDSYFFVPFSGGGRNCMGQHLAQIEAKIILSHFIRTFKFQKVTKTNYALIMRGPYGVWPPVFEFQRRI